MSCSVGADAEGDVLRRDEDVHRLEGVQIAEGVVDLQLARIPRVAGQLLEVREDPVVIPGQEDSGW